MTKNHDSEALRKSIDHHNLIITAFMCATTLAPAVLLFLFGQGEWRWFFVFILVGFAVSRMPGSFLDRLQLSGDLSLYKRLKVPLFKKFATNGDFINKRIRLKFPHHRNVSNLKSIQAKLEETYAVEKAHTVLFVFCLLTAVYAFISNSIGIAILLAVGNVVFNLYPNLLQQYNRIRYKRVIQRYSQ